MLWGRKASSPEGKQKEESYVENEIRLSLLMLDLKRISYRILIWKTKLVYKLLERYVIYEMDFLD